MIADIRILKKENLPNGFKHSITHTNAVFNKDGTIKYLTNKVFYYTLANKLGQIVYARARDTLEELTRQYYHSRHNIHDGGVHRCK